MEAQDSTGQADEEDEEDGRHEEAREDLATIAAARELGLAGPGPAPGRCLGGASWCGVVGRCGRQADYAGAQVAARTLLLETLAVLDLGARGRVDFILFLKIFLGVSCDCLGCSGNTWKLFGSIGRGECYVRVW